MKTLIVCASRYGSTKEIGGWIAERLGDDAQVVDTDSSLNPADYDMVFLGGGVYMDEVDERIVAYAKAHLTALKDKKTALFAVALDTTGFFMKGRFMGGPQYLEPLLDVMKEQPPVNAALLHGEINPLKLSEKDHKMLMHFYTKILKRDVSDVPFRTCMNKQEVWEFVEKTLTRLEGRF